MRHLASIKTISALNPIDGRDRIELATIDGWNVIVKKGEFSVGDSCVFCEPDSVLPEKPEYEFLRSKGFRIKTMKMAGVVSQGIVFPLSVLPSGNYSIDDDVTKIMGVTQYEPTMDRDHVSDDKTARVGKYPKWLMRIALFRKLVLRRNKKDGRGFPSFISKTDETRVQNMPFIVNDKRPWVASEKIDGQSGSFCLVKRKTLFGAKYEYMVCSRNMRLFNKDNSSYWVVSDKYDMQNKLRQLIGDRQWVAIQGECISPKVQGNKYGVQAPDLYVFNLIYPTGRVDSMSAKRIAENVGLKFVPIIDDKYVLPDTISEILDYANGASAIGDTLREGIVFRSQDGKQSFKAVSPSFLIKYDA